MKKLITIFLLSVLCIQCLPVKEMGKCLFNCDFTEEETCKKVVDKKELAVTVETDYTTKDELALRAAKNFMPIGCIILTGPSVEITSPPPDHI